MCLLIPGASGCPYCLLSPTHYSYHLQKCPQFFLSMCRSSFPEYMSSWITLWFWDRSSNWLWLILLSVYRNVRRPTIKPAHRIEGKQEKPGRHEMWGQHKHRSCLLIRKNDVLAILLQGKKRLSCGDLKINLRQHQARSSRKPKTTTGLPWVNSTSKLKWV